GGVCQSDQRYVHGWRLVRGLLRGGSGSCRCLFNGGRGGLGRIAGLRGLRLRRLVAGVIVLAAVVDVPAGALEDDTDGLEDSTDFLAAFRAFGEWALREFLEDFELMRTAGAAISIGRHELNSIELSRHTNIPLLER